MAYWVVVLVAPRKRNGGPGINLLQVSATPDTWKVAHKAISPMKVVPSIDATLAVVAIPGAMLAGVAVPE